MEFVIDDEIFERFAGLSIAIIQIKDTNNSIANQEIASLLSSSVNQIREDWSAAKIAEEPRIISWREAYRSFKAKPKKYKSSIENLLSMVLGGRDLNSINSLVDLYNIISLKYLVPAGGDDLDHIDGGISLVFAQGSEQFIPLNGTDSMPPKPGEVVYRDAKDILCRRWNWRECDKSKLTENSKNVVLVLEGLPPVTKEDILNAANELVELVLQYCGGSVDVKILDIENRIVEI